MRNPKHPLRKALFVLPISTTVLFFYACSSGSGLVRPQIASKSAASSADSRSAGSTGSYSTEQTDASPPSSPTPAGDTLGNADSTNKDPHEDTADKDPPDPSPASDDATHGKGGLTGDLELKSASGLNFLMNAPADVHSSGKAYGVLVLLHGSSASNYRNFIKQMAKVAQEHDLIRVSVLAPNGQGWNEGGEVAAADALHALVQEEIFKKYNIDKKKVIFSGQSSGGGFLSTNFVPQHAKDYQGGALMQCGAAAPRVAFAPDAATKSNFRLHFEITTGDPIWPASYKNALVKYAAAGMQFSKDDTKPGGHCAFDQQQVIRDHIDFILGKVPASP